jgi:hypothetical protein
MRDSYLSVVFLCLVLSLFAPAICGATESCPWLNAATAAGALKGPVTFTVTHAGPDKSDATCEFVHQDGVVVTRLQIEVDTMIEPSRDFASYTKKCGRHSTPLRAIGNEALACSLHMKTQLSEQVVSRVREHAFIVGVSSNNLSAERSVLRENAQKIAEQVAGFLF